MFFVAQSVNILFNPIHLSARLTVLRLEGEKYEVLARLFWYMRDYKNKKQRYEVTRKYFIHDMIMFK